MAIKNITVGITESILLTATAETAFLAIFFCNTSLVTVNLSIHVYNDGDSLSDDNIIAKEIPIPAGDTYIWTGDEKLILDSTDVMSAIADNTGITSTITYKEL